MARAGDEGNLWWRCSVVQDKKKKKTHIFGLEVKAACELIKHLSVEANRGREIVIGIDNSASRCAINRGLSAHEEANALIEEALKAAAAVDLLVTAVGVPGIYNIADIPTRPNKYDEFPAGELPPVSLSEAEQRRGLKSVFDPWVETWTVMRAEWMGHRLNLAPEEINSGRDKNRLIHTEFEDDEEEDEEKDEEGVELGKY